MFSRQNSPGTGARQEIGLEVSMRVSVWIIFSLIGEMSVRDSKLIYGLY